MIFLGDAKSHCRLLKTLIWNIRNLFMCTWRLVEGKFVRVLEDSWLFTCCCLLDFNKDVAVVGRVRSSIYTDFFSLSLLCVFVIYKSKWCEETASLVQKTLIKHALYLYPGLDSDMFGLLGWLKWGGGSRSSCHHFPLISLRRRRCPLRSDSLHPGVSVSFPFLISV